jgi:hypothetical protein
VLQAPQETTNSLKVVNDIVNISKGGKKQKGKEHKYEKRKGRMKRKNKKFWEELTAYLLNNMGCI